jgi:hypothetical protein
MKVKTLHAILGSLIAEGKGDTDVVYTYFDGREQSEIEVFTFSVSAGYRYSEIPVDGDPDAWRYQYQVRLEGGQ